MLFQENLRKFPVVSAGLIAFAATVMAVLPLSGAEATASVGEDDSAVLERLDRWFSVSGLFVGPVAPEAPASVDCVVEGPVAVGAGGAEAKAASANNAGCPEWVALDDFEDVDYGENTIGITMCGLDAIETETVTGSFSIEAVIKKILTLGAGAERSRERTMCIYPGCGLDLSEAEANHSVRT